MSAAPAIVTFPALGTYVHLQTTADPAQAEVRCRQILDEVDLTCSRFRADSDLSRVNAAHGSWVRAPKLLVAALRVAVEAARQTDGLVDPCLGRNLVEIGYDVDFEQLGQRRDLRSLPTQPAPTGAWADLAIEDDAVRVPRGASLDLGATCKAWASDLVAHSLAEEAGGSVLVSLGGDISIAGSDGEAAEWPIEITEHPGGVGESVDPASIWLDGGGLATSSTRVRRWRFGGIEQHHLLDPRTGRPADGPWRTVTATGPTCVAANTASTAALVLGQEAPAWLEGRGISARLVGQDGQIRLVGQWPAPILEGVR